jgi:hypothetical protein
MEDNKRYLPGEEGSVLIIALLIMVLLTVVGLSVTATTDTDIQIAKNDQFHKTAFLNADSGVYTTPKFISTSIDDGACPPETTPPFRYLVSSDSFYRQVMGFDAWDGGTRDLQLTFTSYPVDVDVNRTGQQSIAGGGVEFASGAEGIGVGSAGGVAIFFDVDSLGNGPKSSQSNVGAMYRKVVGVAGGL